MMFFRELDYRRPFWPGLCLAAFIWVIATRRADIRDDQLKLRLFLQELRFLRVCALLASNVHGLMLESKT